MEINKNSPLEKTCNNKDYNNFFEGINYQTRDTFFFAFIIQFILVSLMYYYSGTGKYWNVLFYSSFVGLMGAIVEHSTIAFICQKSQINNNTIVVPFFVNEIFWIMSEYSIPYLNLIKLEAFSKGTKKIKIIKSIIYILFIPFSIVRLYDGYDRMMKGYLNTDNSKICHGIAFGIMGLADIICSFSIIYFIKKIGNEGRMKSTSLRNHIKNSSYTILIIVDFVSLVLSILFIISTFIPNDSTFGSSTTLFHCLKSVFVLILTTNSLIFKCEFKNQKSNSDITINYSQIINSNSFNIDFLSSYNQINSDINHRNSIDILSNSNTNYLYNKPLPEIDISNNKIHPFH